ncbi:MAG: tetratricopeptide repeat protein, partial [Acidobacteriota bacterium]
TNLFVGIARDMGMTTFYVDVNEAIKVRKIQDLIVARGHVCAGVRFPYKFVLYDFAEQPERAYRHYAILDDMEAMATFLLARTLNRTLHAAPDEIDALLDGARDDTKLALAVKPDFAKAYVNLGTALLRLGQRDEAIAMYERAVDRSPHLLAAHLALGYVYAQDGRNAESRREYEEAAGALPDDPIVLYHLGVAQYRDGALPAARRTLLHAVELEPSQSEAWAALGLTYRALKDEPSALRAFLTAASGGQPPPAEDPAVPSAPR